MCAGKNTGGFFAFQKQSGVTERGMKVKKISTYMLKYWYYYLIILVCMLLAIGLDMFYPMITKEIVNKVFTSGDLALLPKLLAAIVLIGIGRSVFGYFKEFTADKVGVTIGTEMRKELFTHIQGLSMDYFGKTNTGELMARVKDDVDHIMFALGFVGMLVVQVIIHVVSVLYCMFHLNWKLTFIPLAFMTLCGTVAVVMERKLDKIYEDISEENAELTTVAEENLAGVRTVKAFAREKYEIEKFLSHNKRYYELNMSQARALVRYYPIFSFVGILLPIVMTVLGGYMVMKGEMDIGSLVAYVEYSRNCTWPMEMLGWLTNDLSSAVASYKKIKKIYGETAMIKDEEQPVVLEQVKGDISFEHVSFSIEGKNILSDINFTVPAGKTIGIMYSKEDILFKALQVNESRASRWCQKVREPMLKQARRLSSDETRDLTQLENIWYEGDNGSADHYNWTRYYALNLHSVFYRGTVEWRCFNSTLHAGKVAAYVNLCLAMSAQAINQRSTVMRKTYSDNELFTFRVWLVRLGLNGDEFKNTRNHLLANLEGDRAWRYDRDTYEANKKKKKSREMER